MKIRFSGNCVNGKFAKVALCGVGILSAALCAPSMAEIYLDQEPDPLPMVELTVVLPVGFEAKRPEDVGVGNLLSDMIEGGTATLSRQEFQERLAEFGASVDFSVGNQYSEYTLSFPVVAGKHYDKLVSLLKENWNTPRFDEKTFEVARTKIRASMQSSLDSDPSLAASVTRRFLNKTEFGGFPLFLDSVEKLNLPNLTQVFERDFHKAPLIWAGVVAPKSSLELVKTILASVFSNQGKIIEGPYLKKLPTQSAKTHRPTPKKIVLIVDKDQRAQMVTSMVAVSREPLAGKDELSFGFANHILFDSGLASVFSDEVRTKRGLAYAVGSSLKQLYELPVLSVSMNPVREKQEEALEVLAGLLKDSFETDKVIRELPQDVFERQIRSFKNSKILSQSTPSSRLGEKSSVVSGGMTPEFYLSDPQSWNPTREQMIKTLSSLWSSSTVVIALVGEAKELRPLVEKHFKGYSIKVIPYKDSILSKTFE